MSDNGTENIAADLLPLVISIDDIRADPANAREGHDLEGIADSLHKYGQRKPIVINSKTMTVEAGNGTYQAAKAILGWTKIAAVKVEDDAQTATGYSIADNRLTDKSAFNFDILGDLLGSFDDPFEIPGIDADFLAEFDFGGDNGAGGDTEPQIDKAEELQEKWGVEIGQVWKISNHRLFVGDSTKLNDELGELPGNLIFDPPWDGRFNVPAGEWENILAFTDGQRIGDIVKLCGIPTWLFVWDCVTSWYTPNRPLKRHKCCLWYGDITKFNFNGTHYGEPLQAGMVQNSRGEYQFNPDPRGKHLSDLFQQPITKVHSEGSSHSKPLDWIRLLIGDCMGGDIYDPFLGSGVTLQACEQLGFKCSGCEIDPGIAAVIVQLGYDLGLSPQLC